MNQLQSETNVCGVNTIEGSFSSMKLLCKEKKTSLFQYFENSEESKNDISTFRIWNKNLIAVILSCIQLSCASEYVNKILNNGENLRCSTLNNAISNIDIDYSVCRTRDGIYRIISEDICAVSTGKAKKIVNGRIYVGVQIEWTPGIGEKKPYCLIDKYYIYPAPRCSSYHSNQLSSYKNACSWWLGKPL